MSFQQTGIMQQVFSWRGWYLIQFALRVIGELKKNYDDDNDDDDDDDDDEDDEDDDDDDDDDDEINLRVIWPTCSPGRNSSHPKRRKTSDI